MQAQLIAEPVQQGQALTQFSVLIIDDDEAMAEVLAARLAQQGFQTLTALEGAGASPWPAASGPT